MLQLANTLRIVYNVFMSSLGENLKELRRINDLSQGEFARRMKTSQQRVSEWERNKVEPSLLNIVKIIRLYNITFEELIDGVEIGSEYFLL